MPEIDEDAMAFIDFWKNPERVTAPGATVDPQTVAAPPDRRGAGVGAATAAKPDGREARATPETWGQRLVRRHPAQVWRAGAAFPGVVTWLVISSLFWAPLLAPAPLAVLVIAFNLYWIARSVTSAWYAYQGYQRIRAEEEIDWRARYESALDEGRVLAPWESVYHVVVIPNLNEKVEKLRATLQGLADQQWVARQIIVVLAMEEKEKEAPAKARQLQEEFRGAFAHLFATFHPHGLPGETPGKSSNESWAARWAKAHLVDRLGYNLDLLTISSCDADSVFHPRYFSCLTYKFCTDPDRHRKFWQSPMFLYNNIWEVPAPIRLVSVLSNVNFLADLTKPHGLVFPQSTYSFSLRMCDEVGYWDEDVIPEDWHMFLKCFFHFGGEVSTDVIYLPTGSDAVQSPTYFGSLVSRYKQAKRHAWGAVDIPYAWQQALAHPEIPREKLARRLWALTENHLLWSTHWFVLSLGGAIPALLAPELRNWIISGGLPTMVSVLLTLCLAPFVVLIALDAQLRPQPPDNLPRWQVALMHFQWFLLPVTSLVFAALPAVDAQTRLMLGKDLVYHVTEKV
jgi:hypothetical protein